MQLDSARENIGAFGAVIDEWTYALELEVRHDLRDNIVVESRPFMPRGYAFLIAEMSEGIGICPNTCSSDTVNFNNLSIPNAKRRPSCEAVPTLIGTSALLPCSRARPGLDSNV